GSRFHAVRRRPGDLGQRVPAACARRSDVEGGAIPFPARFRIRTSQAGRFREDGGCTEAVYRALSQGSAVTSRSARIDRSAGAMARTDIRLGLLALPALTVFAAFWLLPMARLVSVGASGPRGFAAYAAIVTDGNYFASLVSTVVLSM